MTQRKTHSVQLAVEYRTRDQGTLIVRPHEIDALKEVGHSTRTKIYMNGECFEVSAHIDTVKDDLGISVTNK